MSEVFVFKCKNSGRFPGFEVVVVTCFDEILDDFHDFSECVFFQKNQQPIWGSHRFSEEK